MRPKRRPTHLFTQYPKEAAYSTARGVLINGLAENVLGGRAMKALQGKVQLIFTSPPFPLNRKKKYGNLVGDRYLEWLVSFGPLFKDLLKPSGSIVIELGNSWEPGQPTISTLHLRALLKFQEDNQLHLCQEIICHNPARLPGPTQWVNRERIRLKDSYTRLWWLAKSPRPKANNRHVLQPYSDSMQRLIATKKYNAGKRPSQHNISKSAFNVNHGGSIPPSVLVFPNTRSADLYQKYCRAHEIEFHPARMQTELPEFFIKFLTDKDDVVLDPFAGSNTTGAAAEGLGRHWISVEPKGEYIRGSLGRFPKNLIHVSAPELLSPGLATER